MSSVNTVPVLIQRLDPDLPLPFYARAGDAGMDLFASESVTLQPGERKMVGTAIAIALPAGYVGLVHPRSGLAAKHGVTVVNSPGTIDAGYRGEIKIILLNTDKDQPVTLDRGSRIAQLIIQEFTAVTWQEVEKLPGSDRGERGFGSSGTMSEVEN